MPSQAHAGPDAADISVSAKVVTRTGPAYEDVRSYGATATASGQHQHEQSQRQQETEGGLSDLMSEGESVSDDDGAQEGVRDSADSHVSSEARGVAENLSDWLTDGILARVLLEYRARKDQAEGPNGAEQGHAAPSRDDIARLRTLATEALTEEIARAVQSAASGGQGSPRRLMGSLRASVEGVRASASRSDSSDSDTSRSLMDLILKAMEEGSVDAEDLLPEESSASFARMEMGPLGGLARMEVGPSPTSSAALHRKPFKADKGISAVARPDRKDSGVDAPSSSASKLPPAYDNSIFQLGDLGSGPGVDASLPDWASALERRAKEVTDRIQNRLARVNELLNDPEPSTDDSADFTSRRPTRASRAGEDDPEGAARGRDRNALPSARVGRGLQVPALASSLDKVSVEDYAAYLRSSMDRGIAALQTPLGFLSGAGRSVPLRNMGAGAGTVPEGEGEGALDEEAAAHRRRREALDEEEYLRRRGPGSSVDWKPAGLPPTRLLVLDKDRKPFQGAWTEYGKPPRSESDEGGEGGRGPRGRRATTTRTRTRTRVTTRTFVVTADRAAEAAAYEMGEDFGSSRDFTVSTRDSVATSDGPASSVGGPGPAPGPAPPARKVQRELGRFGVRRRVGLPRVLNSESFESDSVLDEELRASNSHESSDDDTEAGRFRFPLDQHQQDGEEGSEAGPSTLRGPGAGFFAPVRRADMIGVMMATEDSDDEFQDGTTAKGARRLRNRKARDATLSSSSLERGIEQLSAVMRKIQADPGLPLPIRERLPQYYINDDDEEE